MRRKERATTILLGLGLCLSLVLASCAPTALEVVHSGPRAWIGAPRDGSELSPGVVPVLCHAFAQEGVARVEFSVNGSFAGRFTNTEDPEASYVDVDFPFEATQAGTYALQCQTTDQEGAQGVSEPVTVVVTADVKLLISGTPSVTVEPTSTGAAAESPTATGAPTSTATSTGVPTPAATSTALPTATPTSTATGTATTPPPPKIASFQVSQRQITAGECVAFNWRVEGSPTEIYFDGEGVTSPDSRDRCPEETTTYTLRAVGLGGEDAASLVVEVIQAPEDTEGPTIDSVSQSPQAAYCSQQDQVQITVRVDDASGIASVQLYCELSGGITQPKGYCGDFSRSGNKWAMIYDPNALNHCPAMTTPVTVKYWIRATDNSPAGNETEWGPGTFSVNL